MHFVYGNPPINTESQDGIYPVNEEARMYHAGYLVVLYDLRLF